VSAGSLQLRLGTLDCSAVFWPQDARRAGEIESAFANTVLPFALLMSAVAEPRHP
jgi:hypothetical protein